METNATQLRWELGITGLIVAFQGWLGWLVLLYVTVMVIDWLTGSALAIKERKWNSSTARQGLWHKCGSIIATCVAALTDILLGLIINNLPSIQLPFNYNVLLCPIVLVWYIATELGSILENAIGMGAPVPTVLKSVLEKVENASNGETDK